MAPGVEGSIPFGHPTPQPSVFRPRLLALAVAAVTIAVFSPAVLNGFVWDDEMNLLANPDYRGLGWHQIRSAFSTTRGGHWIPITWISFGLDYVLSGMNPAGYHITNLLLHAANAALFYLIAERLLVRTGVGRTTARAGGAMAAMFFALHPLRVESVAWVTERKDVLSAFFVLIAVLAYLEASAADERRRRGWLALSLATYVLALASKSMVVTLPVVLLVLDLYPLRRLSSDWREWFGADARRVWLEKLVYFIPAGVVTAVAFVAVQHELTSGTMLSLGTRVAVTFYNLASYVWRTALPLGLSPLYELPDSVDPLAPRFIISAVAVVAVTIALILVRRLWPAGLAVWAVYVVMVLPVSGPFHNGYQITTDRYSYLPCLGFALLAGGAVAALVRAGMTGRVRPIVAQLAVAMFAVWLTALSAMAWTQVHAWRNDVSLWLTALDVDPDCAVCHANLGVALFNLGQPRHAALELERALALRPKTLDRLEGRLGLALLHSGRPADAAMHFEHVLAREPSNPVILTDLGRALAEQGRWREAAGTLERAIAADPRLPLARYRLARTYVALGNLDAARAQYAALRSLDPALARELPAEVTRAPAEVTRAPSRGR